VDKSGISATACTIASQRLTIFVVGPSTKAQIAHCFFDARLFRHIQGHVPTEEGLIVVELNYCKKERRGERKKGKRREKRREEERRRREGK
jgi:hypothetical protein